MGFLVEVSGHKLESSPTRVFVWFSNLFFQFYKILFMIDLKFLVDFFVRILFNQRRKWFSFLLNPPAEETVNSMDQSKRLES